MKSLNRIILFTLLLILTACGGARIRIDGIEISFPTRAPSAVPSATALPSATIRPSNTPTATASPVFTGITGITTTNVNLRSVPDASSKLTIIKVLFTGTTVHLVSRNAAGDWAYSDNPAGWVYTQNLSYTGAINSLPIASATPIPTIDPTPTREGRPKTRISYNINAEATPDYVYLKNHLISICPTTVLVMNGFAYALELYAALRPCGTLVAHRVYSYYEGDEWVIRSPQTIVNQWIIEGHPEIIRYNVNEPSYGGNHSIQSFIASQVELMRLARAAGFTCVCGNLAVGTWNVVDFQAGYYDPLLIALELYGHFLGLHEYTQTVLAFGVSQWPREYLLDRNRVQPANWPTLAQVPLAMTFDPAIRAMNYPRTYHYRRGDWFILRADQIGVNRPRIWLTEWGWDSLADIKASIEPLRNSFGIPKYLRDLRGVNTYELLWAWYWPQWTFAQAICEQIKWGDRIYPPEYIGMNLFTWGLNPMWLHTDFSGRENNGLYQFHDCIEDYVA